MGSHEVDGTVRSAAVVTEQVAAAAEPGRQFAAHGAATVPQEPDCVPETVVPLSEAPGELAQLVAACTKVPRFGDQHCVSQLRLLLQRLQERSVGLKTRLGAPQGGGQVEAEAVDAQLLMPVAQAVQHQAQ